ncbi:MAG: fold metallo-hydrolase [Pseudonocardiales bacterium]|nr:fold metallo-hydrolase [Pseudonocardiales bacterium]
MQLTKFGHSCVRIQDGDRSIVIDPGVFTEVDVALDGAQAVLITHEHPDHLDADRVRGAALADPRIRIWAPESVAAMFRDLGAQVVTVAPGSSFEAAGFEIQAVGGQHALIHPTIPVIANVGYLVAGVYHPGDSLIVPREPVQTLLAPIHAPWSKTAEVIDFVVAVRARQVHQIHDALLNEIGLQFVETLVARTGAEHGSEFRHLAVSDSVAL